MTQWHDLSIKDRKTLEALKARCAENSKTLLGYPCNLDFDYSELLPLLTYCINNVGDPYNNSYFRLNTHDIEREVLAEMAELTHAPPQDYWGYITNGGTEGNMYGIYLGRELLPEGIVYFSEDTHYSVAKSLRVLNTRSIMIKSLPNGEIDYDDLRETIRIHRDAPPIIFANIGTTMKGAIDDVTKIRALMKDLAIRSHYIHCDAALSGMILPFINNPPAWDFSAGIDSLSISGHKFIGSPLPCGVVLAKKKYVDRIARSVEYVGVLDTTLTGSRNAFTPVLLWYALRRFGHDGLAKRVKQCLETANYAIERFKAHGIEAWRNLNSITVVFPRPSDPVLLKWQIAPYQDIAHLITMPHVTRDMIDAMIADYVAQPPDAQNRLATSSAGSYRSPGTQP